MNAIADRLAAALALCELEVEGNFYPYPFLATHSPFIAPIRGDPAFARVLAKAERRLQEFSA
jgi:hypothetical protein